MRTRPRFLGSAIVAAMALVLLFSGTAIPLNTSAQANPPAKPTELSTEAGDTQVMLSWEDPTDSTIDKYQLWQIAESATLTGAAMTKFGYSVAVAGDIAVVGMPDDDESSGDSGAAFVFSRVDGVWTLKYKLKSDGAVQDDGFGNSVAFDGETIVVGAPLGDSKKGAAYLFVKPGEGWDNPNGTNTVDLTETAKLTASDGAGGVEGDEFGNSVAVDGDTVVVGAYAHDGTKGAAYVFSKPGTGWASATETAKLTAGGAESGDEFGYSVAVDSNTIVVGASGDDGTALKFTGSAFVFVMPGSGGWVSTSTAAKLTASTRGNNDYFGRSVAIDGDTIVVGADEAENTVDGSQVKTGSAYVFTKPGTGWATDTETAKLTASDSAATDKFGYAVAVDSDTVVVGAYGNDSSRGSAYVFTKPASGWDDGTEAAQLTASDRATNDRFGSSVAVDGGTVVVGAENNETAYVFDIDDWADIAGSDAATTSHIVRRLTNDIEHIFRVRAVDGAEASDPSDYVSETPKAAAYAPARPRNFSVTQTGDGEVELTWDAHRYPLTVTGYEYNQDDGGGVSNWINIEESDSGTVSHTVKGLTAVPTYTFAVHAVNSAGSTESDSRSLKLSEAPAAPDSFSAVAGDEQVWLGWRSPADFTISGYEYRQKEGTDAFGDWQTIPGSRSGTTFHIVTGLSNGTSYTFQVRAVNAAGKSDWSGEQSATPVAASSAPVKPEGFAAIQTGTGQVELTWEASSNPLNVTGYQFRQNSGSWTTISESDHSTVSHIVTGLTQGGAYTFRVRAVNRAGSPESDSQSVTIVGVPAAPDPFAAEAGDTQVRLTWDPGNASITKYQLLQFPESIKLISDDRDDEDELGWSVAVDGDTLVIGALGADEPNNTGAAYIFTRDARGWAQVGKLTAEVRRDDAGFGYAVAVHGDTIVVGAYEDDFEGGDAGAAYVFTRPANGWADMTQTARLTAGSDAADGDEFGTSVAVHGDTIVVGAPEKDVNPDDGTDDAKGSAYIFTRPADGWGNWSTLDADGKAGLTATLRGQSDGDRFGRSVAVHGDTVVVGAHEEGANDRGKAYVFTKSAATGVWDDWHDKKANDATARLTASDRATNDKFGYSVAIDGDTIVVGVPFNDDDGDSSGSAYVFTKVSGVWSQVAKLTADDGAANDEFGYSVAIDGSTIVVGARQDDSSRGSVYVFTKPQSGWTDTEGTDPLTAYDRRGNDQFGNSVAVDGYTVLVGAVGDDSGKGSAYVFGTEWSDIPDSGAGTISHIARGLRNNVEHAFRVRAVNAAGAGGASEVDATPMSANSLPSRPANFTATQTGVDQVRLAWTASTEPLTVRHYTFKQGSQDWAKIDGSDSSTVSHTVTGLTAGIEYTFAVRAVNGGGQNSSPSKKVTIEAQAAAPTELDAIVGDEQVKLSWDDPEDSTIEKYQHFQIDPSKLTAADGLRGDLFGYSVAVDGNTAVIGAYQDDDATNGDNSGSAYVFTKVSGVWKQVAKLTADDGAANDEFGISVAVDGDTIVVGAHQNDADTNDNDEGAAYVFTKPALGWGDWSNLDTNGKAGLTTKLTAFGAAAGDEFGISVAVDGDTILVGAHQNDSNKGAAYIFTKFSGVWGNAPVSGNHRVETAKLVASDGAADDEFGISVALDGNTAVIGAYQDNDATNGDNSGSAYVFTKVSGVWSQKAKLIASDGAADDEFGISVALDGNTAVIGAHQDDDNGNQSGSAYVFTKPSSGWSNSSEMAKLTASDGAANDEFGISVAVEGDTAVIGARQDDTRNGSAYVFTKVSGVWSQKAKLTASDGAADDEFGISVAVDVGTVLVGAYKHDVGVGTDGANAGAAYFLSALEWADIPDSGAATTSHIVTGLTNDVEHTFQVRGVNAAGGGLTSDRVGGTPMFAIPDPPDGLTADAGDAVVDLTWVDPEDSTIEKYQLLQITQGGELTVASTDDPVVRGDGFGISVAVDGDTAVVGAYQDDDATNGDNSGSAHVFTRSSPTDPWSWVAKLTASDAAANDEFGYAVAIDGDTAVVGMPGEDSPDDSGAAFVFTRDSGVWGQKAKLTASDAAANDEFGISVAVHGNTIVVGAHQDDDATNGDNSGSAYVFTKPAAGWATATETAKLTASDAAADDEFGISVAVDGDTIVVGAHLHDANTISNAGAVYVFEAPSGGWATATETAKLTASDGAANDDFGISVAVYGDTVVVGAYKHDVGVGTDGANAGAAYVFTKPDSDANDDGSIDWKDWASLDDGGKAGLTAKLIAFDAARGDEFGISVAVDDDGDTIVVGAYLDDDNGDNSGSAYVFTQDSNSGKWSHTAKLTGPSRGKGDWLGHSVAVVGNTVIAGADKSNISGPDSGAVYLWTVPGWTDIANSDATTTSHTITSLTNRVEYSLRVRAVDAVDKVEGAGAGPPSEVRATPLKPRPAKPTGLSAAPGDTQVRLSWDLPGESSPPINSYQLWHHAENAILTADTREANDEFGYAVAIDGDTAVVGMPGEDSPDDSGAAFVFTRDSSGTWNQVARLRASDPGTQDTDEYRFGLSVAVHEDTSNGDTIVVGAPDHSGSKGAVYVFTESGGWANDKDEDGDGNNDHITETAKFLASDGTANDEFGISVAVDGDTIVVGAHNNNAAYIFTKPATGWANDSGEDHTTETLKLSGSGSSSFGRSVAVDGDTVVVGASGDDSGKGSTFVFIEPATGWVNSPGIEAAKLAAYFRVDGDGFGRSVAIDGKTIVVGAYGDDSNKGSAYVFSEPDTGWANSPGTETAQLIASDGSGGDKLGRSVSVDGDTVVVGAHLNNIDDDADKEGSAYVFTKPNAGWVDSSEAAKIPGPGDSADDEFGWSVAIDEDTILVGADWQDSNDQGAAYVYDFQVWAPITGSTGETTSHLVTSLTNDVEHTFAVRAVNYDGAGLPAQASADTATPGSSPLKPRNFSAVQTGAGEVRLEWGEVADPLNITGYQYTDNGGSSWSDITGSGSTTLSYTVSSLNADTTYTFAVRATNSYGDGASSFPRDVTMVAAPAPPTSLEAEPGDEQVKLTWEAPTGDPPPIFTGYQYQQKTGEDDFGDDWTDIPGSTDETESHIVTGLANDIPYTFRVRAVNVTIGSTAVGPESATPSAAGSRPARPTNFNAEQTGVGQVELTWNTAPARLTVTGYQYTDNGGSSWSDITGSDSGTVSYTVSGLMVGTRTFAVRAVNSRTLPGLSSVSGSVTIVGEPPRPSGFSATAGDTQATVQWGVPSVITDRPDKYELLQIPISTLTADDRAANDEFGYSVAIDGNTAVVGAYHRNVDVNANVGVAYVFTKDSDDAWSQAATLTASDGAAIDEFGISVAIDGNTIVVGARQDDTRNGAAYVFTKSPDSVWANDENQTYKQETAKLTASDGAADDEFGISVALDGDIAVIGAHQDDDNGNQSGSAYVFTKSPDSVWANDENQTYKQETAKLIASDGAANDELGISVAVDGDTVVVGAHLHDINDNAGAAYVFIKPDTGGWANEPSKDHRIESARLTAPDGAAKDEFGISVAIDGNTVVVGAHQPTYQENNIDVDLGPGAAYVFTRDSNSGKWSEASKLTASNGDPGDGFGISVAVDGNTAVVGAYLDDRDNAAHDTGSTYVFARKFGVWSETLNLAGPDPGQSPRLGYSVAVSNDTVLAGVPQDDGSRGSAYAMDISTAKWVDFVSKELTMSDDDEYYVYRMLNLTNDQQYAFRVRSVNAAANRPSAETVAATPMLAKPGRTEGLSAKAGNRRVTLSWNDPRDSSLTGYQVLRPPEQIKLTAGSDGETDGEFGESVAVDDGTAVVGAPEHDGTDSGGNAITDSGAAYVFTRNPNSGAWSDPIELTAGSDGADNDWFGYSVAVDGDTIVVGAYKKDGTDSGGNAITDSGAAYVFTRDSTGEWRAPIKLIADDRAANDWFGYSVAVDGDTVVVGARGDDGKAGAAYVFTRDSDTGAWGNSPASGSHRVETAKLTASGGAGFDYFGQSVAVHGNTIVVGAHQHDVTEEQDNTGAAYVFTKPESGGWADATESVKLTASDGDDNDQFGHSVAVDGDTVVVGAHNNNAAYVFVFIPDSGAWSEAAKLAASDSDGSEEFGFSVAVRASTIVVGASTADIDPDDDDSARSGAAYLFTKPSSGWANDPNQDHRTESRKLTLPIEEGVVEKSDEFGNSVALDGQSIVVGAPQDDDEFGSVYVSDIPMWADIYGSKDTTTSLVVRRLPNGVEYAFQVRAMDDTGEGPPSDIVRATPIAPPNRAPYFIIGSDSVTFTVDENASPGIHVGSAVTATDPEGGTLIYWLSGTDASSFSIDSSTGQLIVKDPLDYETQSVYEVTVRVSDVRNASDDVDVTITITDVDEAWTVSVSLEQPKVGTPVAVSLSDLDGSLSDISWQWARSSDGSNWSDISGANSDSYTPVADDVGIYLRATVSYTDGHGPGKSAHVVMERQTAQRDPPLDMNGHGPGEPVQEGPPAQRDPSFEGDDTLTVDENAPPGSLVGDAITATDPDGDVLTYSLLSGADAASFVLDGSTGQITVGSGTLLDYESGPTRYTVVVSVHDGRGADGNDDTAVDDLIEVTIDVSNVDEAGTVSVSLEQPEVGIPVAASLSDLDGSLSDISWQWARSSDGSNWSDISGANSDSYTPVADDVGIYLRATASYTDGHGPGKSAHAVMERQTAQRDPSFEGDVTLTVDENTPPGSLVGDAITATDPDGDVLTYSLSGTDAASFVLDGSTGQITVGSGTLLDYESGPTRYTVVVSVHDGRGAYGNDDTAVDDLIEVTINVSNVDEAGTVSVSLEQPEVGIPVAASLSDLDGSLSDISWQWAASSDRMDWQDMAGASSSTYTPVDLDADKYLRVIASYADGEGSGKQAQAVLNNPVQGLPEPVATPTTTATDTPTPEPTPTPTITVPSPTPTPTITAPSPTPTAEPAPSEADGGDEGFPWWVIVAVVIWVVTGVVLIIVVLRSRR